MAFFSANELFVIEESTGAVKYVVNGTVQSTVIDVAVKTRPSAACSE